MRFVHFAFLLTVACSESAKPPSLIDVGHGPPPGGGGGSDSGDSGGFDASLDSGVGAGRLLATLPTSPAGIAASGTSLYVTVASGADDGGQLGGVLIVPKAGGAATTMFAGLDTPFAITASSDTVCFTTKPGSGGNVYCSLLTSPNLVTLTLASEPDLFSTVLSGTRVYWATSAGGLTLESAPSTGGASDTNPSSDTAVPKGIALGPSTAYVVSSDATGAGALYSVPLSGGVLNGVSLSTPDARPFIDAVWDGSRIIVGAGADLGGTDGMGKILALPVAGGATTILASGIQPPGHLARDASHIYWTSPNDGFVYALSLVGTSPLPVVVAGGINTPQCIAVDDAVYFTNISGDVRSAPLAP